MLGGKLGNCSPVERRHPRPRPNTNGIGVGVFGYFECGVGKRPFPPPSTVGARQSATILAQQITFAPIASPAPPQFRARRWRDKLIRSITHFSPPPRPYRTVFRAHGTQNIPNGMPTGTVETRQVWGCSPHLPHTKLKSIRR